MTAIRFVLDQKRKDADSGRAGAGKGGTEPQFGPMEEDAEILTVDFKFSAEFLAVGFVEEEALEDAAVLIRELGEDLADGGLALLGD